MEYTVEQAKLAGIPDDGIELFISTLNEVPEIDIPSLKSKITADFSTNLTAQQDKIRAKVNEKWPTDYKNSDYGAYINTMYDDKVVVNRKDKCLSIPYSIDENGMPNMDFTNMQEVVAVTDHKPVNTTISKLFSTSKGEYGDVPYADEKNKKYPIDNEEHCRAAWSYINMPRNSSKYSATELKAIKSKIVAASKKFGITISSKKFHIEEQYQAQELIKFYKELIADGSKNAINEALAGVGYLPVSSFKVNRDAKIFEAGEYPDKEFNVTEDDLDNIISNYDFAKPAPIKVEHGDSLLDGLLGGLTNIWRQGKDLFGTLSFTDEAWGLVKQIPKITLSSGVYKNKSGIKEVSLAKEPRVEDAAVFSGEECMVFNYEFDKKDEEVITLADEMTVGDALKTIKQFSSNSEEAQAIMTAANEVVQYVKSTEDELKIVANSAKAATNELKKANCDRLVEKFKREGKITPASESFARAIISAKPLSGSSIESNEAVSFNNGTQDVSIHFADAFVKFLESLSPVISFQELAKIEKQKESDMTPDMAAFYRDKMGLDPDKVAETIRGGK
jgi:hypothetical protein